VTARPPSFFYKVKKAVVRHPLVSGLSLLLLLATAALVWVAGRGGESWVTVVKEDFSQPLGPEWKTLRGELAVHDGALCSRNGHAVFEAELGDRVSVDVSATVPSDSKDPRELSAFISGSMAAGLANGYSAELFILDELGHAFHGITRLRQFADRIPAPMPERGRSYQVSIERASSRVAIGLDGTRLVEIDDPAPLTGPDHNRFGIGSKCDHIHYDDLEIRLPLEEARRFISRMLVKNDYRRVEPALASLLAVESDPRQRSAMSLLRAKALLRLGRIDEAETALGPVDDRLLDGEGRLHRKCIVAELLAERSRFSEAFDVLRTERQTEGRWWTVSERMRTVGRSIARRLERVSKAERERILRSELEKELAPFSVDLAYALANEHQLKLEDLEPQVRGVLASWFGAEAAIANAAAAQEAGNLLYYSRWQAGYLVSVALWLIAEGRADEASPWLERADAADTFSGPVDSATFVYALRGDAEKVRARMAASDLDSHYQLHWQARSLLVLDDVPGARKAYGVLLERYRDRNDVFEIVEARVALGEMTEQELDAAAKSPADDLPLDYAATRSAVVGIARELAGDTTGAIEAYRAAQSVRLPDIGLMLLARNRLAHLAP
jgi:tetratricopeptide (TPR) repeat protein